MISDSSRSSRSVLAALLFSSFISSFVFQIASILPLIIQEFQITHAQAGLLMTVVSIPGFFLSIFVGNLIDRYGAKLIGTIALFFSTAGSFIVASSPFFSITLLGRFIIGIGARENIIIPIIISQWFDAKRVGMAMGFHTLAMTLGSVITFAVYSNLGLIYGWRTPYYFGSFLSLVSLITFFFMVQEGPLRKTTQKTNQSKASRGALSNFELWKVSLVFFWLPTAMVGFSTWFPTFMVEFKGISLFHASLIASISFAMHIFFSPFWGWFSDRVGKRKPILVIASISWVILLPLISLASRAIEIIPLVIIYGFFAASMPPLTNALIAETSTPEQRGTGFGMLSFCVSLASMLGPLIVGYARDVSGSMFIPFVVAGMFAAGGAVNTFLLKTR